MFQYAMLKGVAARTGFEPRIPKQFAGFGRNCGLVELGPFRIDCAGLEAADLARLDRRYVVPYDAGFDPGVFEVSTAPTSGLLRVVSVLIASPPTAGELELREPPRPRPAGRGRGSTPRGGAPRRQRSRAPWRFPEVARSDPRPRRRLLRRRDAALPRARPGLAGVLRRHCLVSRSVRRRRVPLSRRPVALGRDGRRLAVRPSYLLGEHVQLVGRVA